MVQAKVPDGEFIRLFEEMGGAKLAAHIGTSESNVFHRRSSLERKHGRQISSPSDRATRSPVKHPERARLEITDGVVLVGSDLHAWPGDDPVAYRAFVRFAAEMSPKAIILNGDVLDLGGVSRHPPIGWTAMPGVQQEIEASQALLHRLEKQKSRKTRLIWSLGNHDARFETRIATVAREYAKVHGTSLQDHFPAWEPCWSIWVNPDDRDGIVVKHRYKGGIHASHNNTLWAGRTLVTGHTHQLKVSPLPDYNGIRWGVETGCLADPYAKQFQDYTEDNPRLWQSGFAVLTWRGGKLLQPELVRVADDEHVDFRGQLHRV